MKKQKIGIMGFGRIGREFYRLAQQNDHLDIVAIVDLAKPEILHYLQEIDGFKPGEITLEGNYLISSQSKTRIFQAKEPSNVPWDIFGVDTVIDCTHKYCSHHQMEDHLKSGAKRVIISALPRDEIDRIVIMGVNDNTISSDDTLISAGSSTTNALALTLKTIHQSIPIKMAMVTTVHAFTSDQPLQDVAGQDFRRSRSAAENIIPNMIPSAAWMGTIIPELKGKVEGIALNVPVSKGSMLDITLKIDNIDTTVEDINNIMKNAASKMNEWIDFMEDPIVSSDVIGDEHSLVFDSQATMKTSNDMVKILCWYDNVMGQAARVLDVLEAYSNCESKGGN